MHYLGLDHASRAFTCIYSLLLAPTLGEIRRGETKVFSATPPIKQVCARRASIWVDQGIDAQPTRSGRPWHVAVPTQCARCARLYLSFAIPSSIFSLLAPENSCTFAPPL